jgi:hypothetical protein
MRRDSGTAPPLPFPAPAPRARETADQRGHVSELDLAAGQPA